METDIDIKKKIRLQKILFICGWPIIFAVYILGMKGNLPTFDIEPEGQVAYVMQIIAIAVVLGDLYLCVKKFNCNPYCIPFHILLAVICVVIYFSTLNTSYGVLALMLMCGTIICHPSVMKSQMNKIEDNVNNQTDKTTTNE